MCDITAICTLHFSGYYTSLDTATSWDLYKEKWVVMMPLLWILLILNWHGRDRRVTWCVIICVIPVRELIKFWSFPFLSWSFSIYFIWVFLFPVLGEMLIGGSKCYLWGLGNPSKKIWNFPHLVWPIPPLTAKSVENFWIFFSHGAPSKNKHFEPVLVCCRFFLTVRNLSGSR